MSEAAKEIEEFYRRCAVLRRRFQDAALRSVPTAKVAELAERLGLPVREDMAQVSEGDLAYAFDLAVHTASSGRSRAIERVGRQIRTMAAGDEAAPLVLRALVGAWFSAFRVLGPHPESGLILEDALLGYPVLEPTLANAGTTNEERAFKDDELAPSWQRGGKRAYEEDVRDDEDVQVRRFICPMRIHTDIRTAREARQSGDEDVGPRRGPVPTLAYDQHSHLCAGQAGLFRSSTMMAHAESVQNLPILTPTHRVGAIPELVELILDHANELDDASRRQALRHAALVCSSWRTKAQRRLFERVRVESEDTMDGFRAGTLAALRDAPSFDLATLQAEQNRIAARLRTFEGCDDAVAMWEKLGDPKTCPHGNPIPGAGYLPPPMVAISSMEGTSRVERISEELELDPEVMAFLDENGIRPAAEVELVARTPDGIVTVRVDGGSPVGLSPFIAERVYVVK